jgi:hypothetical protein
MLFYQLRNVIRMDWMQKSTIDSTKQNPNYHETYSRFVPLYLLYNL